MEDIKYKYINKLFREWDIDWLIEEKDKIIFILTKTLEELREETGNKVNEILQNINTIEKYLAYVKKKIYELTK